MTVLGRCHIEGTLCEPAVVLNACIGQEFNVKVL